MNILVLNGSPRANGHTATLVKYFKKGAEESGHKVKVLQVGTMNIRGCIGCEYCHNTGNGECVIKDDMQKVYSELEDAEIIVFASPVYYWGFTGQFQSTLSRFYSIERPPKAKKYALLLTSYSPDVYDSIISQYKNTVAYFGATDAGIVTAYGEERTPDSKFTEAYHLGKNL